jgi:hypothetical protein
MGSKNTIYTYRDMIRIIRKALGKPETDKSGSALLHGKELVKS